VKVIFYLEPGLLLYNLTAKMPLGIVIGTRGAMFFALGASSNLFKINLSAEVLATSGAYQLNKVIVLVACVDRKFFFFFFMMYFFLKNIEKG
jgi:hypothetical protein